MIPGPSNYIKLNDWNAALPRNAGKFKKSARVMLATEIINNAKMKERTSPGPAAYNQEQWRSLHGKRKNPPMGAR